MSDVLMTEAIAGVAMDRLRRGFVDAILNAKPVRNYFNFPTPQKKTA